MSSSSWYTVTFSIFARKIILMKLHSKLLFLLATATVVSSCSYKVYRSYEAKEYVPDANCTSRLFKNKDLTGVNYIYKGAIVLDESGITAGCKEEDAIEYLKKEACNLGANTINIIEEAYPDLYSSCYRCIASFYTVARDTLTTRILNAFERKIIAYGSSGALEWDDFRIPLPEHNSYPYQMPTSIDVYADGKSFWLGVYSTVKAEAVFYEDVSKLKPSYRTPENLAHVNGFFDLAQIQAFKLADTLNSIPKNKRAKVNIDEFLRQTMKSLKKLETQYQSETDYGANTVLQEQWYVRIEEEKKQYGVQ